jgi:hypothetical protein
MDENTIFKTFDQQKIMTIENLTGMMQCSTITARRRLKKWNSYTSINKNGRYYTLPHIPDFNADGIWKYKTVLFSQNGNLKHTIVWLIHQSPAGLSAAEISEKVDLPSSSSFFLQLTATEGITREKHARRYVYYYGSQKDVSRQKQRRVFNQPVVVGNLTDLEAVALLVALIKNPDIEIEELAAVVQSKGRPIDTMTVQNFLESHDLLKKISYTRR